MKTIFCLFFLALAAPLLLAQPSPANDGGTTPHGGDDGASGGLAPLVLINPSELNYSAPLPDSDEVVLKNTSEQPNTLVVLLQTEDWLTTSYSFLLEPGQEIDFNMPQKLSPVKTIQILSMQPFEVTLKEFAPLFGSAIETIIQAQAPPHDLNRNFIEDAGGQIIPVGVMEDGSVHYPLFGKRIGVIEDDAVLIDGTQQRFELLRDDGE